MPTAPPKAPPLQLNQDVTAAMPPPQEEQELMTAELRHFVADIYEELDQRLILHQLRLALRGASIPVVDDDGWPLDPAMPHVRVGRS